jgi:PTH1 family peptidyl-tRNA hydrolase
MKEKFNFENSTLIAGLGNPGNEYERTFHNAGAQFVSFAVIQHGENIGWKKHSSGLFTYAKREGRIFLVPLVFMNESGSAILRALSFFKIPAEKMIIAHDDSDIGIESYKIDYGRGAAGHRGVANVMNVLGTKSFWRIRIGIRDMREEKRMKAETFVLSKETREEKAALERTFLSILEETHL